MSEKNEMACDQANIKPYFVLNDDALNGIAAGIDDRLAHLLVNQMPEDLAKNGLGTKPENAAAVEERLYEAYRLIDKLK